MRSGMEFESNWPIERKAADSCEPAATDYTNESTTSLPRISQAWREAQEERPGTIP